MHMEISEHYAPFEKKTLIVVTNNDMARLFHVEGRTMDPLSALGRNPSEELMEPFTIEERQALYKKLNKRLQKHLAAGYEDIVLCAPEVRREQLVDELHPTVLVAVGEVIPKNLAALDEAQIMRILQEGR